MRSLAVALAALALLLAGCATPTSDDLDAATQEPPTPPPAGGHDHTTHDHGSADDWTAAEEATIRPGVQVVSETGQCTSNFVFKSLDNRSLYLGLAAHCVEGLDIGAPLEIAGGAATGTLAYSSWLTMDEIAEPDPTIRDLNDFALVLIPDDARALVHPSMRHFGGPVALADSSAVSSGDKVLTYGNSGLRQEVDALSWHEGYVVETSAWSTTIATATPGVPGDSGSGVLTGDGRALGILVTLTLAPLAGTNGVTHLDRALAYAVEHAGLEVELATWELADAGVLP